MRWQSKSTNGLRYCIKFEVLDVDHVFRDRTRISIAPTQSDAITVVSLVPCIRPDFETLQVNIMQTETLEVSGMTSEASAHSVIKALTRVKGVQTVKVSFNNKNAIVEFDEKKTAKSELLVALAAAGFNRDELKKAELSQGSCCGGCCNG
jgi:periplasmic mercuric ion binding protein